MNARKVHPWLVAAALASGAVVSIGTVSTGTASAAVPVTPAPAVGAPCAFKIQLAEAGAYRVDFDALAAAGLSELPPIQVVPLPSANLQLTWRGQNQPVAVIDGGDGVFGPGDHVELIGDVLHGASSYFDELTRFNVYRLDGCSKAPAGAQRKNMAKVVGPLVPSPGNILRVRHHFEEDRLLLRFMEPIARREGAALEGWYWAKLTQADEKPFSFPIQLNTYDAIAGPLQLDIDLRGWSHGAGRRFKLPDHQLEVLLNGQVLGTYTAEGQERVKLSFAELPSGLLLPNVNHLQIRVPQRIDPEGKEMVDVMMLNSIEVSFPRKSAILGGQQDITLAKRAAESNIILRTPEPTDLVVLDDRGRRWAGSSIVKEGPLGAGGPTRHSLRIPADSRQLSVVPTDKWRKPLAVEVDLPSEWLVTPRQADYLMIVHPALRAATEPLAEFHRSRGLKVEIVDIRDVFDEVNHGLRSPVAIREFLRRAWEGWQAPKPRWVLLVGDASWDTQNEKADDANYADWTYQPGEAQVFLKNSIHTYSDVGEHNRDLIPAWPQHTFQGHAASDNYFVDLEGDDNLPEMAIGRLPVVKGDEVAAIVAKTIRYSQLAPDKAEHWREELVFITNEEQVFKGHSDSVAARYEKVGYDIHKIYPADVDTSNELHTAQLRKAFDDGTLLVHFLGHGGRYIWRTGPPDFRKNHDLFTLEDLEKLAPNDKLPMVLSMTCYSAPFDHPTADSIGEKFLRMKDRGAIAVLAASWRNNPTELFSHTLMDTLMRPGVTIGEAIQQAKRTPGIPMDCVQQYNLLGDPALVLALPPLPTPPSLHANQETSNDPAPASPQR